MVREPCQDMDVRSSKLRQPTQYASPPCKARPLSSHTALHSSSVKFRSISDLSDDGSDSDSSVFPMRRCLATSFSPLSSRKRLQYPTISPTATKHSICDGSTDLEATVDSQRLRLLQLEDELAECQAKNVTLEEAVSAAARDRRRQDKALRRADEEIQLLRRDLQREEEKSRLDVLQSAAERNELLLANQDLRREVEACHAALTAWQEQAKQAEGHTRRLWQERLEMEYEVVRSVAKCNQESAKSQRAEELKAVQGLRSVSQSVFKDENESCEDDNNNEAGIAIMDPSLQRRRRRRPSTTPEAEDDGARSCWMDDWIERQVQRHQDGLKWLDTIEHHLQEDAVEYEVALQEMSDTMSLYDGSSFLAEVDDLLQRNVSVGDMYGMCRISHNEAA
ncbi:hypothetical protein DYB25_000500 [Aphanomyces astaci]|uniref:Uncharacterized protein n=1 Tax=Aphanomyces astaci TaxID=112090 RepID=A0A397C241_APHAT|nr:hypothetical protein DYB25_000500 [Aphanomyces astaci]RHY17185.1 hypothetical protein DYB36_000702 [Aphanomyces astaci]RHY38524.1 hypothetical protein DYB38_003563 [Aphanomyces astaci]RHY43914.1 hypothetical protein DYB30_000557 [Aphanomyces astaci]RHY54003.1 hypothetical protein DYB34_002156 [Aphanomyces astaci]